MRGTFKDNNKPEESLTFELMTEESKELSCNFNQEEELKCTIELENKQLIIKTNSIENCENCVIISLVDKQILIKNLVRSILTEPKTCPCKEEGTYLLTTKNSFDCKKCPSTCSVCESELKCTKCKSETGVILKDGLCQTCSQALNIAECKTCQKNEENYECTECESGNFVNNKCTGETEKEEFVIFRFDSPIIKNEVFSFHAYFFSSAYPLYYTFTLNIILQITDNNRVLSDTSANAKCIPTDILSNNQNIYSTKALCGGNNDYISETSTITVSPSSSAISDSNVDVEILNGIPKDSINMGKTELDANDFKQTINIVVDKIENNGWNGDDYYFVLISKNPINNNDKEKTISLDIKNEKITSKAEVNIPEETNLSSFNCIIKNLKSGGTFKISNNAKFDLKGVPEISVTGLQNKNLIIEEKNKNELTKGAKIGIIVGCCVFIGIIVATLIMYKIGVFCKGSGATKNAGYTIAPDKSRNIVPGEVKDNQSGAIMIRKQNEKNRI